MMKKLFALVLALVMVCGVCAVAAGETLIQMPELKMTMTVPDDYIIVSADTDDNVFTVLGMDKEAVLAAMKAQETYAIILPGNFDNEINIVMSANDIRSFDDVTDAQLNLIATAMDGMFENMGCQPEKHDLYTGSSKYIRTWYNLPQGDATTHIMQYYTIENNMGIIFRMYAYTGEPIAAEMENELKQFVDQVVYD